MSWNSTDVTLPKTSIEIFIGYGAGESEVSAIEDGVGESEYSTADDGGGEESEVSTIN